LSQLKARIATCEFGELRDDLLRDRIVTGIYSEETRKSLLRNTELTLEKAINTCQVNESSEKDLKLMQGATKDINAVKPFPKKFNKNDRHTHQAKKRQQGYDQKTIQNKKR
jgi:hypothetical protein